MPLVDVTNTPTQCHFGSHLWRPLLASPQPTEEGHTSYRSYNTDPDVEIIAREDAAWPAGSSIYPNPSPQPRARVSPIRARGAPNYQELVRGPSGSRLLAISHQLGVANFLGAGVGSTGAAILTARSGTESGVSASLLGMQLNYLETGRISRWVEVLTEEMRERFAGSRVK